MKQFEVKHIHASVSYFNGRLYFVIDNRLFWVDVGTPNFNDYGEWRLSEFKLSHLPYDPSTNAVELTPYDIESFFITEEDLQFLDMISNINTDDDADLFVATYGERDDWDLAGGTLEGDDEISIYECTTNKNIKYSEWLLRENKTSYERILYPILNSFRLGYINHYNNKNNSLKCSILLHQ